MRHKDKSPESFRINEATMNVFGLFRRLCGLSILETAEFLKVAKNTAQRWESGRGQAPEGVIDGLRQLHAQQRRAAAAMLRQFRGAAAIHGAPAEIEIGYPTDDVEARSMGWPCASAFGAAAAMAAQRFPKGARIIMTPRGATLSSAAAADIHDSMTKENS